MTTDPRRRWRERVEFAVFERRWLLFAVVLAVYLATASYGTQSIDVVAAELPAWSLATSGQLWIAENPYPDIPWLFLQDGRLYSDRFPGAIAYLAPAYWISEQLGADGFSKVPGAVTAAVVSAVAVLVMNEVYGLTLGSRRAVHLATFFTAFGTGAWSVCANAPWSHTLNFLLLALAVWALARGNLVWAGLALGGVTLTRPHWAVASAALGLGLGAMQRSAIVPLKIALGMVPGVTLLVLYNGLVFGQWGISNGHELGGAIEPRWTEFPVNVLGGLLSPTRGVLFFYPIVLVGVIGLPRRLSGVPPWQLAAALAAACGIAIQLLLNRYSGGDTFFGPRLWIEPLVLMAPLLATGVQRFSQSHPRSPVVPLMVAYGCALHAVGAIVLPY